MFNYQKEKIHTDLAPQNTGPYSQALKIGPYIYTSGEGPLDPKTGEIVAGSIEEQTQLTFQNIEAILNAAGATLEDVVKVSAHLQDINDFERFNQTYESIFTWPIKPVRTTVGSDLTGIKVEVDVVAFVKD